MRLGRKSLLLASTVAILSIVLLGPPAGIASGAAAAPGVSSKSIKIGVLSDETGPASGVYAAGNIMALESRIDWQNAHGGVNGRKIDLIIKDTASSDETTLAAAQTLVQSDHVFAVWAESNFLASAARYLNEQGIPVVGIETTDTPVWGTAAYTNMFSYQGAVNANAPVPRAIGKIMKSYGVTNLGVVSFSIPASMGNVKAFAMSAQDAGIKVVYQNYSAQLGQTDYTSDAIAMKNAGVEAFDAALDPASSVNIVTALKQAGANLKFVLLGSGYGDIGGFLSNPSTASEAQGFYFVDPLVPDTVKDPGTIQERAALAKYGHFTGFPGFNVGSGYTSGDVLVEGLKVAGSNPTRASFIKNLHAVHNYTGNGLLPKPVNFATPVSKGGLAGYSAAGCFFIVHIVGNKYVVANNNKATCDGYTGQFAE